MEKRNTYRWSFLFLSFVVLIAAGSWKPTIYGNDEASIRRYLYQEQEWGDHIQILAVEDDGEDRIAVFRLETKRPDERFVVRFRKNEDENYVEYGLHAGRQMYCARQGRAVWTDFLTPSGSDQRLYGDQRMYFVAWSENPELGSIRLQVSIQEEQIVLDTEAAPFTVVEFEYPLGAGGYHAEYSLYDTDGNEL